MGKSKAEKEAEKKAEEERLKSPTPPERQAEYYAAVDKIEADNAMVDKMQNKKGSDGKKQEWSKKDYTKADFVQFSDGIANGEGIHIDNANENVYKKYDKETGEYVDASYKDRFKYQMQKSFVDNTAGLPTDLLWDSVYYGAVSHFFRDFTKGLLDMPLDKLSEWWSATDFIVADIAFMEYDEFGLLYYPAFVPGGDLMYPVFKDTKILGYEMVLDYDEFQDDNNEGDEPGNERVDVEAGPEFFQINEQYMGVVENDRNIIGKLSVRLSFSSMAHFADFNNIISNIVDICHASLRLRTKRNGLIFGTDGKEFGLDLILTRIGSIKLTDKDQVVSRDYEFKIFVPRKPDVVLNFPNAGIDNLLNKDLYAFYTKDKDLTTYKIICGNAEDTKVKPTIDMTVRCQITSSLNVSLLTGEYKKNEPDSLLYTYLTDEKLTTMEEDIFGSPSNNNMSRENSENKSAKFTFGKPSGDVSPDAFFNGMDLKDFYFETESMDVSKRVFNSDSLGFKISRQEDGQEITTYEIRYTYGGNFKQILPKPSAPAKTEIEEKKEKVKKKRRSLAGVKWKSIK